MKFDTSVKKYNSEGSEYAKILNLDLSSEIIKVKRHLGKSIGKIFNR